MRSDPSSPSQARGPGAHPSPLLLIIAAAVLARGRRHRRSLAAGVVLVSARLLVLKVPPVGRVIMKLLGLHRSAVQTTLVAVPRLIPVTHTGSGRWTRIEDSWVVEQRVGWCAMSRGGEPWRGLLII